MTQQIDEREREIRKAVTIGLYSASDVACLLSIIDTLRQSLDAKQAELEGVKQAGKAKDSIIKQNGEEASRIHKYMYGSEHRRKFMEDTRPCTDSLMEYTKALEADYDKLEHHLAAAKAGLCGEQNKVLADEDTIVVLTTAIENALMEIKDAQHYWRGNGHFTYDERRRKTGEAFGKAILCLSDACTGCRMPASRLANAQV